MTFAIKTAEKKNRQKELQEGQNRQLVTEEEKGSDTQTQMQSRIDNLAKYLAFLSLLPHQRVSYQSAQPHGLTRATGHLAGTGVWAFLTAYQSTRMQVPR